MLRWILAAMAMALMLAACGSEDAIYSNDEINTGDVLARFEFEEAQTAFETGDFPEENARLYVENGVLNLEQSGESSRYIWGQGGEIAQNVDIRVDATSQAAYDNNLYGVMCRVNSDGEGYAFLVSNDGFGAIARADLGRRLSLSFIVPWVQHDAIHEGQASNTLRAVCIDDYLALYVNDTFIADVRDDEVQAPGEVGVLGGFFVEGVSESGEVVVQFDNLTMMAADLSE
ncbi:MAG: hypothetical protein ACLFTK_10715 [Anaerolineales bacterium]